MSQSAELTQRRARLLGPAYRLFYDEPLHIVRGEGVWLYDADGRQYLDMYNNVPHVGHCHPRVVAAIRDQVGRLNTHTRYLHENVVDYAERLTATMPDALDTAMFCCTGSEANELALRIARTVTGRRGVIATSYAYHGNSQATWEISTDCIPATQLPDHVAVVPEPDCYRGPYPREQAGEQYARHVHDAIALLEQRGFKPAAFIVDTIMSSSGVVTPPAGYLRNVAAIIREAGGLFIADEVQPGFGRTGANFWGFAADEFVPDIVTMGKPMGNGHPIAAVVARSPLVSEFAQSSGYFNTFGGNPVSCAAALAVLDVIEDERLQANARDVGRHIVTGLEKLAEKHSCVGDIRGNGLFIALELVDDGDEKSPARKLTRKVVNDLRNRGVLTSSIGRDDNILKLRPPLVLTKTDASHMLNVLDDSLTSSAKR